jgi:hypothetical protein
MPGLTGLTALDVAIGLFFLYFLLSIVCSTISETIAGALGWRAANLELAIRHLIQDPDKVAAFWRNPRIRALGEPVLPRKGILRRRASDSEEAVPTSGDAVRKPSYLPARSVAITLLDTLAPEVARQARETDPSAPPSRDVIRQLREGVGSIENDAVRTALFDVLDEGRTAVDDFRRGLEGRFDELMDRASGWYKRRAQRAVIAIAIAVTVVGNVDTIQVASGLWNDDALRASVVQQATAASEAPAATAGDDLDSLAEDVEDVGELGLPLGWGDAGTPDSVLGWIGKVLLGWPVTILALAMGAPFWFDVLGKFARLRGTGNREGTSKDDDRAPEDRDDPSRRRPAVG